LCGSVRCNRKGLPTITAQQIKSLERGEWLKRTKGDTTLVVWKDQKIMWLLFNHISSNKTTSLHRWVDSSDRLEFQCPQAVYDYFYHARSVDVINQLHYSYLLGRKSRKPWFRLAWWCIDMCILNAFKLWSIGKHNVTQLQFRKELMHSLVKLFESNHHALQVSRGANVSVCLARDHYPEHSDVKHDCVYCSHQPSGRKQSRIICHSCNVHLCIGNCFAAYHARA